MSANSPQRPRTARGVIKFGRRKFVSKLAGSVLGTVCFPYLAPALLGKKSTRSRPARLKKIAVLATEVRKHSHAQHFIDRLLEGYGWEGRHYRPQLELAGLYVDQVRPGDLSHDRIRRFGLNLFPTVSETLTLGTSSLAVDGVLIIAEHGRYPRNEKGQTLYPRYAWFKEVIKVFESSGHSVPVFNDKHLSTDWSQAQEMIEDANRLGFAFLAGSSLPVTWRIPPLEIPLDSPLTESVAACYGGVDSYDFHGLETAQCMSERRAGGETGVKSIQALRGAKIWERLKESEFTEKLLLAALARSHSIRPPPGYTVAVPSVDWIRQCSPEAIAYFIEHADGFQTTMFLLNGLISDFTYAGALGRSGTMVSCQMHLPMPPHLATTADFFNPLLHHIEKTVVTGIAPYPAARTLLTSGMTLCAVESLFRGGAAVTTPELKVSYDAPVSSGFWNS